MANSRMTIRHATAADADFLARAALVAGHGIFEIMFDGLVPGVSAQESFRDRRVLKPGHFSHFARWQVAVDDAGAVLGAANAFPNAELATCPPDPLLTAERMAPLNAMGDLESNRAGSYYLNLIATFPEHQGRGVGQALVLDAVAAAKNGGFPSICLTTWGDDPKLMRFYANLGFRCEAEHMLPAGQTALNGNRYVLLARELA